MAKKSNSLKKPVTFSLGTVLLFVLAFGAVGGYAIWQSLAAPHKTGSATLMVAPNPASVNSPVTITGCGYVYGKQANINVLDSQSSYFWPTGVDSNGCISTGWNTSLPGNATIKSYQTLGGGHKSTLMGSTVLVVQ